MAIVLPKFPRRRSSTGGAPETQPALNVALCREDGVYEAGSRLDAKWRVRRIAASEVESIEVSVLWHTEGKGDQDLHVHHFKRWGEPELQACDLSTFQALACELPASPLSYHGHLIHLRWCLRLRLFLADGREVCAEQPFHLVAPGIYPLQDSDQEADQRIVC